MKKKLLPEQHAFFQTVADAAFVNPFSELADDLELRIPRSIFSTLSQQELYTRVMEAIDFNFSQLKQNGKFKLSDYRLQDRKALEISWLYFQYRLHQNQFDQHIREQQETGDTPLALPFADQLINEFRLTGYTREQSGKYIALFFQLRRGFYFINLRVNGQSKSMVKLRMHLWNNIFSFQPEWYLNFLCEQMEDFSTLLLGETGTGKSMVAQAIGSSGFIPFDMGTYRFRESFTRSYQSINLSQFSSNLLESELFGHKKGAFTGAIESHQGVFARCSTFGAVFIDEIGDIDISTQVKLLTVIQERFFYPVGSHTKNRFKGRVIAATNKDLDDLRFKGQFRDDLYYRLCSDVITIPALRRRIKENPDELRSLIQAILNRMFQDNGVMQVKIIETLIRKSIPNDYEWPGNVRELEQCIRQIVLTGSYQTDNHSLSQNSDSSGIDYFKHELTVSQLVSQYCLHLYQRHGNYEAVARISGLDRRTVKKHILLARSSEHAF